MRGALRALLLAPFLFAGCGGSGGVAGPGSGVDGARGDAPSEDRPSSDASDLPTDAPTESPPAGDAAVDQAAAGGDGGTDLGRADATGDGRTDGGPSTDTASTTDTASPGDGIADRADATPGDAPPDQADATGEHVSMACTAPGACDPFDPNACGAQLCRQQGDGNTACVAAAPTLKALGATCASSNECGDGQDCVRVGDDPGFTCQRACPKGSLGFCGGELRCTSLFVGCIQFCRTRDTPCDIYAQSCADPTRACALSVDSETGERYTGCRPAGPGARGDRCEGVVCGKGLLCVREGGVSTCRQICTGDGGALPCAGAGETCSGTTSTYQITYCK